MKTLKEFLAKPFIIGYTADTVAVDLMAHPYFAGKDNLRGLLDDCQVLTKQFHKLLPLSSHMGLWFVCRPGLVKGMQKLFNKHYIYGAHVTDRNLIPVGYTYKCTYSCCNGDGESRTTPRIFRSHQEALVAGYQETYQSDLNNPKSHRISVPFHAYKYNQYHWVSQYTFGPVCYYTLHIIPIYK